MTFAHSFDLNITFIPFGDEVDYGNDIPFMPIDDDLNAVDDFDFLVKRFAGVPSEEGQGMMSKFQFFRLEPEHHIALK